MNKTPKEVFTEELEKCRTILAQQEVMIEKMKEILDREEPTPPTIDPLYHYHIFLSDGSTDVYFDVISKLDVSEYTEATIKEVMGGGKYTTSGYSSSRGEIVCEIFTTNNYLNITYGDSESEGIIPTMITATKEKIYG